jgi:ubiquinone/menaquinone biosynthesis C-methylase UbiE
MTKRRWLGIGAILALLAAVVVLADQFSLWWGSRSPDQEAERVVAMAKVSAGQTVAEIGAGRGEMARVIAPRLLPGGRLILTELNDARLGDLRSMASAGGWSHVDVRRGDPAGTSLAASCCDLIYMRHVFHHFGDPPAMARALYEALVPGGRVVVIDFAPHWILGLIAPVTAEEGHSRAHGATAGDVVSQLAAVGFIPEHQDPDWTPGGFMVMMRK